jgi:hypothetical protein
MERHVGKRPTADKYHRHVGAGAADYKTHGLPLHCSISGSHKRRHGEEVDGGGDHNEAL